MLHVVDTNLLCAAQGSEMCPETDSICTDKSRVLLETIKKDGVLLLDDTDEIVREYVKALGFSGRPGVGKAFAKWAWDNRFSSRFITRIHISKNANGDYVDIPDGIGLDTFDSDDRKFLATAFAVSEAARINVALDSDWANHAEYIRAIVPDLCFVCSHLCNG